MEIASETSDILQRSLKNSRKARIEFAPLYMAEVFGDRDLRILYREKIGADEQNISYCEDDLGRVTEKLRRLREEEKEKRQEYHKLLYEYDKEKAIRSRR